MRRWSLAGQMLVLQLLVVAVTVAGLAVLALVQAHELLTDEASSKARAVAVSVAASPSVLAALDDPNPSVRLQPYAEQVRHQTGVDFITIMKPDGTRYTHPTPAEIGKRYLGHTERALAGETFSETYTGTLGESRRVVTPVMSDGRVRALVSAGITINKISARVRDQLAWGGLIVALALSLGAAGTWLVTARLRRQTHGLGPVELGRIHEHHDAVLHAVREGVIIVGAEGRLLLANDEAHRLLDLPADAEGRHALDLGLAPDTAELLASGRVATDEVHLVKDRLLAVNQRPTDVQGGPPGSVATLRDSTERPVTVDLGTNTVLGAEPGRIAEIPALLAEPRESREIALWDGHAGDRAADVLIEFVAGTRMAVG